MSIRVFHRDRPDARLPMISRDARLVVWPGVGAQTANMNYVVMAPNEANAPHEHGESEDTIYVVEGVGTVADLSSGEEFGFEAGQAIHIPPGVRHQVRADRGERVISVGGPCPPDWDGLRSAGVLDGT